MSNTKKDKLLVKLNDSQMSFLHKKREETGVSMTQIIRGALDELIKKEINESRLAIRKERNS